MNTKPVVRVGFDGKVFVLLSCPRREKVHVLFDSFDEVIEDFSLQRYDIKVVLIDKIIPLW